MADAPRHEMTPGQLAGFLISSQLGLGILGLPRYAVEGLGHAGWLLVLDLGLVSLAGIALITSLGGRFRASIVGINFMVLGKTGGFLANLLVFLLFLASSLTNLAVYLQTMRIFFFRETPTWVLTAFLVAPTLYQITKGLKVIARFDTFVYLALFFLLVMMATNVAKAEWSFLFPLTQFRPENLTGLARAVMSVAFGFLGHELLLVVYPWVEGEPRGPAFLAGGVTVLVLTSFTAFTVAFFGESFLLKQVFPLLGVVRTWQAPVVDRLDIYFLMFWLPAMGAGFAAFLAATQLVAAELFPRLSYRFLFFLLGALVTAGAVLLRDFDTAENAVRVIAAVDFFGLGLALPALLLLLARLRGVGE
ncbi:MAG: GerAB/ArcD/ProY family transporter [Bacillota bacterium]